MTGISRSARDNGNQDTFASGPCLRSVLVSYPQEEFGLRILRRFISIFSRLNTKIMVIAGSQNVSGVELLHVDLPRVPGILRYSFFQAKLTIALWRTRKAWDCVWFLVGGTAMALPIAVTRIARKKAILVWTASPAKQAVHRHGPLSPQALLLSVRESLALTYSSHIVTYGRSVSRHVRGLRSRNNVLPCGAEFVDFSRYSFQGSLASRPITVGYVGRLSAEKGVLNFVRSLQLVATRIPQLDAYIVGDGALSDEVQALARSPEIANRIHLTGYLDQNKLPELYGKMRLLTIPSYTEGLPNAMLEAMACGTLVLATRVGAIPDVIVDGVNGFLLDNNSAESISHAIEHILRMQLGELENVAHRALVTVREQFEFGKCVERYRAILSEMSWSSRRNRNLSEKTMRRESP